MSDLIDSVNLLLTAGGLVAGAAVGMGVQRQKVAGIEQRVTELEADVKPLDARLARIETRVDLLLQHHRIAPPNDGH